MKSFLRNIFYFGLIHLLLLSCNRLPKNNFIENGILDLRNIDFNSETYLQLNGNWEFYWEEFLDSNQPTQLTKIPKHFLNLPGYWNNFNLDGKKLSGKGYSSFHLKILTKPTTEILIFKIPDMSQPYSFFINGKKICSNGVPVKSEQEDSLEFKPNFCFYNFSGDEIDLVIHISNYHYKYGGVHHPIWLGGAKIMQERQLKIMLLEIVFVGAALIMCFYHLELYFFRRKDIASFYFGIICFLLAVRILVSGEKYLFLLVPGFSWNMQLHLEYLNVYLLLPAFAFYQFSIFPVEFHKSALKVITLFSLTLIGITIFTTPFIFSYFMEIFEFIVIISSLYAFYVLYKVMKARKSEAQQFLLSFIPLFLGTVNEILYNNFNISTLLLTPPAWILFLLFQSVFLSRKFSKAISEIETLSSDLHLMNLSFKRFVPEEFLAILGKKRLMDVRLGDQVQKEMSILFADIRSFTAISEKMKPEENFNFINNYLSRMGPIIRKNNGFIDKYIGDAIMALFPSNPDDAIIAAIQMQNEVRKLNTDNPHSSPIQIGIGIHTGDLMLGIVGENERIEGTVISDAVNLASRLEGLTKVYGSNILISHQTFYDLEDTEKYDFRILDKVKVKGKNVSVTVIEILNGRSFSSIQSILNSKMEFEKGVAAYLMKDFIRATGIFKSILEKNPDDIAMKLYLERSQHYALHGVPLEWEGVVEM